MNHPHFDLLFHLVEIFFLIELSIFHTALLIVFIAWLARKVLHELATLREEFRSFQ